MRCQSVYDALPLILPLCSTLNACWMFLIGECAGLISIFPDFTLQTVLETMTPVSGLSWVLRGKKLGGSHYCSLRPCNEVSVSVWCVAFDSSIVQYIECLLDVSYWWMRWSHLHLPRLYSTNRFRNNDSSQIRLVSISGVLCNGFWST